MFERTPANLTTKQETLLLFRRTLGAQENFVELQGRKKFPGTGGEGLGCRVAMNIIQYCTRVAMNIIQYCTLTTFCDSLIRSDSPSFGAGRTSHAVPRAKRCHRRSKVSLGLFKRSTMPDEEWTTVRRTKRVQSRAVRNTVRPSDSHCKISYVRTSNRRLKALLDHG